MIRKSLSQLPRSAILLWLSLLSLQSSNPMTTPVLVSWVIIDTMLEVPILLPCDFDNVSSLYASNGEHMLRG